VEVDAAAVPVDAVAAPPPLLHWASAFEAISPDSRTVTDARNVLGEFRMTQTLLRRDSAQKSELCDARAFTAVGVERFVGVRHHFPKGRSGEATFQTTQPFRDFHAEFRRVARKIQQKVAVSAGNGN
jgi:hypothetical protein